MNFPYKFSRTIFQFSIFVPSKTAASYPGHTRSFYWDAGYLWSLESVCEQKVALSTLYHPMIGM